MDGNRHDGTIAHGAIVTKLAAPIAQRPVAPAIARVTEPFRGRDPRTNRTIAYKVGDEISDQRFAAYQVRHGRAELVEATSTPAVPENAAAAPASAGESSPTKRRAAAP